VAKQDVAIVNLDPGAMILPYMPDLDIRDYVNIASLMEEYRLGPNGALIMAADLIAEQVERASGPYIAEGLTNELKTIIYLFDSVFSLDPLNYVSNLFLSAAVYNRFLIPQAHVLSKFDLLPQERVDNIVDWSANPKALEMAIDDKLEGTRRLLSRDMMHAIYRLGLRFPLIPVSSKTNDGMVNLNVALERILAGGDKFTY